MKKKTPEACVMSAAILVIAVGLLSGCGKRSESRSQPAVSVSTKEQTQFERDLDFVRKGQFAYIFVFSRKDGGVFTKDDIAYLKENSPQETNQWIATEDGRRVICGTNFEFKQEHFDALNKRFYIEDFTGK